MAFTKSFPKRSETSIYPQWEDVSLSAKEEEEVEEVCRNANNELFSECLKDAESLLKERKGYETSLVTVAVALFEKRASHVVFWKEEKAREKFEKK